MGRNPRFNSSGCKDETAYKAISQTDKDAKKMQKEIIKSLHNNTWIEDNIDKANKEIEKCKDRIISARELSGIDYSTESIGSTSNISDATCQAAIHVETLTIELDKWNRRLKRLCENQHKVLEWLDMLSTKERDIILYHYIKGMQWSRVCTAMNYSDKQCRRIGNSALHNIEEYERKKRVPK